MNQVYIITTIDSILGLVKDYAGDAANIPPDAKIVRMKLDNASHKILFMLESDEWTGVQPAEEIKFDLRRIWSAG